MDEFRHHHAVRVIFVKTPAAGSPKVARTAKLGQYPSNQRQPWPPRQAIPHRASKAVRIVRFLNGIARQDADVRQLMKEARHAN